MKRPSALLFDKNDYQLLGIVNDILAGGVKSRALRSLLVEHMHPQGIKEMAAPRGLRIAYAIAGLLGTFVEGTAGDRLKALRSLRDEVILSASVFYQKNTARVMMQIMKELVRSRDDELLQLQLAHDFRLVSTGTPRVVREHLERYHLLEMDEEWNQFSFDDRVHDASTKGRKTPTHLVMDAWIKGIRNLTVVYYNFVSPEVVEELIEASAILDIRVQVGIEMYAPFRSKYARLTWEPHGFDNNRAFLAFLTDEAMASLMDKGRAVSSYQQRYVFDVLDVFNKRHRQALGIDLGLTIEPLPVKAFLEFVGAGQPSLLHLARFIHEAVMTAARNTPDSRDGARTDGDGPSENPKLRNRLASLDVDAVISQFLLPARNPEVHDPSRPHEAAEVPELLRLQPKQLLDKLLSLHSSSKFTLNLSNLSIQDTLELLYSCEGMISHIESYNLKDAAHGMTQGLSAGDDFEGEAVALRSPTHFYNMIGDLQKALSEDNVIGLKRAIRAVIWDFEEQRIQVRKSLDLMAPNKSFRSRLEQEYQGMLGRKADLLDILFNLERFHDFYRKRKLGSRIGSSSTGRAELQHGMGLVVIDTIPARARRAVREGVARNDRTLLPVSARLTRNLHYRRHDENGFSPGPATGSLAKLLGNRETSWSDWSLDAFIVHPGRTGNIATLGGLGRNNGDGRSRAEAGIGRRWTYLNTNVKNSLKVLLGFIPAFLTFYLTKDWWVLAYLGAVIWFTITGSRNIIQSVLGGGGLKRSPLLPWNSLVSWSRIADSLLYTGFSVPLLDFLVKTLLLDRALGITTSTNPILLYGVMGLANGLYICSHNLFRGLPKGAAVGNLFRSILAIPLAVVLNALIASLLQAAGVPNVQGELQKWAAIISKFASDCVAAGIEGFADRQTNIRARRAAYRSKIAQLFSVFSRLDLLFPEEDVLDILQSPKIMMETLNYEAREQEILVIVNALDLMYFWMYQPRARKALDGIVNTMSREEWLIFYRSQLVLKRYKEISQVFVDGLVGKNFSKPLSFYLDRFEEYLDDLERLGRKKHFA